MGTERDDRLLTLALLAPPTLFLTLFFLHPLQATLSAAWGAHGAWAWLTDDYAMGRIRGALLQATLSVLLTFIVAIPLATFHHRHRIRFTRLHLAVHAAPFILPVFVVVYGIRGVFGNGGWLHAISGIDLLSTLGPLGAVVLAHAYYNYGFAARLLHAQLERRPHRLEAAARTLGASPIQAFARVTLPLLAPSLIATALLVFLFSFTSFGVVLFLGQGQVSTMETLLYQNLGGAFPRIDRAAVLGVTQLGINVALFLAYLHLQRRSRRHQADTGGTSARTSHNPGATMTGLEHRGGPRHDPGRDTRLHTMLAWTFLALGVLPAASVLTNGFVVDGDWSLDGWRALTDPTHPAHVTGFDLTHAIMLSLGYASGTVVGSIALTLLLAYGIRRQSPSARRIMETIAALPLGTSSLLIGLGYLLAFGAGAFLDLRGSTWVIVVAHTLIAFPFTARVLIPAIDLADQRLEDAARTLGAPPRDLFLRIRLPLLRGPLLAAAGFAIAMSLGDFGASLLLMRPDTMGIAVWIERHDAPFRDIMRAQATLLSGVLMLLATGAYMVMELLRGDEEVFG